MEATMEAPKVIRIVFEDDEIGLGLVHPKPMPERLDTGYDKGTPSDWYEIEHADGTTVLVKYEL
jgi:hypothetical protein